MGEVDERKRTLRKLIEELTLSGKDKLDENTFKQVKNICKQSDTYVSEVYRVAFKKLWKKHAEIRFSAFLICDELFRRSHCFRELLLKDFDNFSKLVLGVNPDMPLPKPTATSKKMKQKAVEAIQFWYDNFKDRYRTLNLAYKYLRDCKKIDFQELTARTLLERQRDEQERIRKEEIQRRKVNQVSNELNEMLPEIKTVLVQFWNCFKLLVPGLDEFSISLPDDDMEDSHGSESDGHETSPEYGSYFMRYHGILKGTSIKINIDDVHKIQVTENNEVIVENIKEQVRIISSRMIPAMKRWEHTLMPYSSDNGQLIKTIIDKKTALESAIDTFTSLVILPLPTTSTAVGIYDKAEVDDDDDDDFVEVNSDDPRVLNAMASEATLLGLSSKHQNTPVGLGASLTGSKELSDGAGPSGMNAREVLKTDSIGRITPSVSIHELKQPFSCERKEQPVKICPDSYLEEDWQPPVRCENTMTGLSQVWMGNEVLHEQSEDVKGRCGMLGIDTCIVEYEHEWEPVRWQCRAPLSSGRLCPRHDRECCPLHGPVIPRDESGKPLRPEDAAQEREAREKYERENPPWQDPVLLAEIKRSTGVDLDIKKARKKKNKYRNLTDIRAIENTPRKRLEHAVLNKRAIRRVNRALAKLDR